MDAETKKTAKPRRRWLRFSLRTLLIVVTVLSVPLGWIGWELKQLRKEQATITWIVEMGGDVDFRQLKGKRTWWEESREKWFPKRVWGVDFRGTQVSDLSLLAELKKLKELYLNNTQVSDLSPLTELKSLSTLSIVSTQVSDLSPLAELKNVVWLSLHGTQVSDLSPLVKLKNLTALNLGYTQVSDLSPLAELKNLEYLGLYYTQVSDLSPLAELKKLKELRLQNTQVSDEQVQELRQALPNCEIDYSIRGEE